MFFGGDDLAALPSAFPPGLKHEAVRGMKQIDCPRSRAEEEKAEEAPKPG